MKAPLFVTGIGTHIGKTVASAVLVRALGADYWKPVQAGSLERTDSDRVREWVGPETEARIHPEAYRLQQALSPHAAARGEGVDIQLARMVAPPTDRPLIIEGAGGLLVPLNERDLVADLIVKLGARVIVVSRHYLGSINHTLLTLEALCTRDIPVAGLIFVGNELPGTEAAILARSGGPFLFRLPEAGSIDGKFVADHAARVRQELKDAELV